MRSARGRRLRRALHLLVLVLVTALGGALVVALLPAGRGARSSLSVALAYTSLAALLGTLAIGPLNLIRSRPNPRSTDLRRDLGLWSVLTGTIHVVLALGDHFDGAIARYFFSSGRIDLRSARLDAFGLGAWSGAAATVVLALLAAVSNDRSIRWLGRRWKQLQRTNYALALLAVVHTALFWIALRRGPVFWLPVAVVTLVTLGLQLRGVMLFRQRRSRA